MKDIIGRLTPLAVMVLTLLHEDEMHPYEMRRLMIQRRDDRLVPVTSGTIYHTVARLVKWGLAAEVGVDRDGNRPERTTYRITDAGSDALRDWVRRELPRIDRPAEFRVALAEAAGLERDEVLALLSQRRDALGLAHTQITEGVAAARSKGVPEKFLVEVDRDLAMTSTDLDWTDGLIARIADGTIPWGAVPRSPHYIEQRKAARQ